MAQKLAINGGTPVLRRHEIYPGPDVPCIALDDGGHMNRRPTRLMERGARS